MYSYCIVNNNGKDKELIQFEYCVLYCFLLFRLYLAEMIIVDNLKFLCKWRLVAVKKVIVYNFVSQSNTDETKS